MVGSHLLRGMLVGVVAGILAFGFLKGFGEPSVDKAIAFETQADRTKEKVKADDAVASGAAAPKEDPAPELVSRQVQAGIGLFTGVAVYSAAFGGLFALAFTLAYGRIGDFGPRAASALLAASDFIAISVVPGLKYPANPPVIGDPKRSVRTALYFAIVAISLVAMIGAGALRLRLTPRCGAWNAALLAAGAYLLAVFAAGYALPAVNKVPHQFPAVELWQFRIASMGAQSIMWATIGLLFGALTERAAAGRKGARPNASPF
jgi:hypothetical protein